MPHERTGERTTTRFHVLAECEADGVKIGPGEYEGEKRQSSPEQRPEFYIWVADDLVNVSRHIDAEIKVL